VLGPYNRKRYVWSSGSHHGHNTTALQLPDGTYAVIVSEVVPFTIYQSPRSMAPGRPVRTRPVSSSSTTYTKWYKMERPSVVLQNGHVTHVTWAVADVDKDNSIPGGSNHGSKIIVVPFDGVAFDNDYGVAGTGGTAGSGGAGGSGGSGGAGGSGGSGTLTSIVVSPASATVNPRAGPPFLGTTHLRRKRTRHRGVAVPVARWSVIGEGVSATSGAGPTPRAPPRPSPRRVSRC